MSGFEVHGYEQRESLRQQENRRRNNVLGSEEHAPDALCGRVNNLRGICNHKVIAPPLIRPHLKSKMWTLCLLLICPLVSVTLGEDTVAEDVGSHQLQRLVELLTHTECEDLLLALSHPEENIFQHLERLSPENNQLDIKPRAKRDTSSSEDSEAECRTALTDWLLRYGERIYYDKLSRSLMHIGRTDIAIEVGTNVNEDKTWNLKRFVDGYHEYVSSLDVPSVRPGGKRPRAAGRKRKRKVKELSWRDLDLVVEVAPVLPYLKGPLDVALPVLYGVLLGFGGSLLAGVSIILIGLHVSRRAATTPTPRVTSITPRVTASSRSKLKHLKLDVALPVLYDVLLGLSGTLLSSLFILILILLISHRTRVTGIFRSKPRLEMRCHFPFPPPSDGNVPVWHRRTTNYPAWRLLPGGRAGASAGGSKKNNNNDDAGRQWKSCRL
ncbi:transmembrane and death domain protein 1-like [Platichthys flesus]|uniref:transmembrane and death domain protein 1-like n=1 Tax=Platichthys flesus TaxID=8260 RepID=UPI002DBF36DA|nr:transmembrane and death domain protein 1-like [Platichthys flesus]